MILKLTLNNWGRVA